MSKILIKNAKLISMSENKEKIIEGIDILIENNLIKKIDRKIQENAEKTIDATGKIVMPGLINTHAHIPMSIFRETVDGYKTQDWLEKKIWPMEAKLTEEDAYYAAMLSFIEMIQNGTTTINDMYYLQNATLKSALDTGVRVQLTRTIMDSDGDGEKRINELKEFIEDNKNKYENITLNIGIHGLYTCSEEYIKEGIEIAKRYNLPVDMHFVENSQEYKDIQRMYNVKSPVDVLEKYFKDIHLILAHCVKLSVDEIERLSKLNAYVSHCPISNLRLGCGIANISKMQENNICISLGTDGQGSGSNLDLFEAMKFSALMQKGIYEDPIKMSSYDILKMATINGARALGLERKIGTIEQGKLADIIIINLETPITRPINDVFSQIVYNVKGTNVETTIVNGKILMENRKLTINVNETKIIKKCEEIIKRIKNNLK